VPVRERVLRTLVASLHAEHGVDLRTLCRAAAPMRPWRTEEYLVVGSSERKEQAGIIDHIFFMTRAGSGQQKQRVMKTRMNHDIKQGKHFKHLPAIACASTPYTRELTLRLRVA
jgi:hypothetical protein